MQGTLRELQVLGSSSALHRLPVGEIDGTPFLLDGAAVARRFQAIAAMGLARHVRRIQAEQGAEPSFFVVGAAAVHHEPCHCSEKKHH